MISQSRQPGLLAKAWAFCGSPRRRACWAASAALMFMGCPAADNAGMARPLPRLTAPEIEAVIATAWDDKPPFHAVLQRHGLNAGQVVQLLKHQLTPNAFKVWKARTLAGPSPAPPATRRGRPRPGR